MLAGLAGFGDVGVFPDNKEPTWASQVLIQGFRFLTVKTKLALYPAARCFLEESADSLKWSSWVVLSRFIFSRNALAYCCSTNLQFDQCNLLPLRSAIPWTLTFFASSKDPPGLFTGFNQRPEHHQSDRAIAWPGWSRKRFTAARRRRPVRHHSVVTGCVVVVVVVTNLSPIGL